MKTVLAVGRRRKRGGKKTTTVNLSIINFTRTIVPGV